MNNQLTPMQPKEAHYGFAYLFVQLLGVPMLITTVCALLPFPVTLAWQNFLCFSLNFLCVIGIFRHFWIDAIRRSRNKILRIFSCAFFYTVLSYAGSFLINILILTLEPGYSNANDVNIATMSNSNFVLMFVGTVILVPPVEEALYRGVLFGQLQRHNRFLGYFVSIAAFAAIHVVGYIGKVSISHLLLSYLQYIPAGFFLARAYERSDNIFAPILMHTMINFIGINSM